MDGLIRNKNCKKKGPYANKPYERTSLNILVQDDLEDSFAKMCLTPSQSKVMQNLVNSKNGIGASAKPHKRNRKSSSQGVRTLSSAKPYKSSPKSSSHALEDNSAKMRPSPSQSGPDSHGRARANSNHIRSEFYKEIGVEPELPRMLYNLVKKAADISERLERHGADRSAEVELRVAEGGIQRCVNYYGDDLPRGWKYDRANARSLLV